MSERCCGEMDRSIKYEIVIDFKDNYVAIGSGDAMWKFCPWCGATLRIPLSEKPETQPQQAGLPSKLNMVRILRAASEAGQRAREGWLKKN